MAYDVVVNDWGVLGVAIDILPLGVSTILSMGAYVKGGAVSVEVVNIEQAAAWDGHEGDVWTEHADRYERAGRRIWERFIEAQFVGRTDRVVDVGCGTGRPTRDIARSASEGEVVRI